MLPATEAAAAATAAAAEDFFLISIILFYKPGIFNFYIFFHACDLYEYFYRNNY
jgi:hypothetical protein